MITHNFKVRFLQVLTHLALFGGIAYCVMTSNYMLLLVSLLIYWTIGTLGVNVGYHRLLSHRSYKTYKPIEYFLSLCGLLTTIGSPLAWVALHRQHHAHAETEKDPHSPYQIGWFRAWFGFWNVEKIKTFYIKDLKKEKFYRYTHKYYLTIIVLYNLLLFAINPIYPIFLYAIPAVLVLHSTSAIIVIAHMHGYKSYKISDESRNSWIANLITLGEGWHNNHHAKPNNWKQGEKWWEWDLPAQIIKVIKR